MATPELAGIPVLILREGQVDQRERRPSTLTLWQPKS